MKIISAARIFLFSLLPATLRAGPFDAVFWKTWGDGKAELAGYDLVFPRDGELRKGTAVAIFVKEPFSEIFRVKADPGKHAPTDEFQVMKLNLVRDFPTGICDYNLMTSAFAGLEPFGGLPAGTTAKVAFSAQEWSGQSYGQVIFRKSGVEETWHSYFDGEADGKETTPLPVNGISEDALFLWARGFLAPFLNPGESRNVRVLGSLVSSRLEHKPLGWKSAQLRRRYGGQRVAVPAGVFMCDIYEVLMNEESRWTYYVERSGQRRLVKWICSNGEEGALLASDRLAYWDMSAGTYRDAVKKLGLTPRPPRTP